jgi:ATP-binding cassette subfamily B protein
MRGPGARILPMRRALRFVWDSAPGWTLTRIALICAQGVLPLLALYVMKLIVDAVAAGIGDGDAAGVLYRLEVLIAAAAGVAILTLITRSIAQLVTEAQALVVTDHVQDVLHRKSVAIDLEYYENSKFHDTLHRAQLEAPIRPTRIVNGLSMLGQNTVSLVAMLAQMLSINRRM